MSERYLCLYFKRKVICILSYFHEQFAVFFVGERKNGKGARSSFPRPVDNDQKN